MVNTNHNNFHGLDAIRGILAIVVCFAHSWQVFITPVEGDSTISGYLFGLSARFAVLWFFCISGYVIALSVSKNIHRFGDFNLPEYVSARAFRILPPLLFVVALVYLIAQLASAFGVNTLPEGVLSARTIYSTNIKSQVGCMVTLCVKGELTGGLNGPLWTLSYEIQLYAVMGLAAFILFSKRFWPIRIIACGALLLYLNYAFHLMTPYDELSPQFIWFSVFGLGVIAFQYLNRVAGATLWFVVVIGLAVSLSLMLAHGATNLIKELDVAPKLICAQFAIAISCSALTVLLSRANAPTTWANLGSFSYTLYIVHFPLLLMLYFVLANKAPRYATPVAWGIAFLAALGCIFFARAVSGVIENASAQRALARKGLNILASKFLRTVSK